MQGIEFRRLAEAVTASYGRNSWFFLRELAQNSRDAGAETIWVTAQRTAAGAEILTFTDDGRGMTMAHARRFLFRLYASDKVTDPTSAGKYGIGFWTVLRFQPAQILVEARTKKTAWAVTMDGDLRLQAAICTLSRPGTRIVLTRSALFPSQHEFQSVVESELHGYCQYLRRNDAHGSMLPVYFHERQLTIPMSLPGPFSFSFHYGTVEGAVGLAERPQVRLYARGLPVWEGASLQQMSHLQPPPAVANEIGQGLAPVFLLNGNRLDVTFSRNLVLENQALAKVRRIAEKALQRLLSASLENAFPRKWHQRARDHGQAFFARLGRLGWKMVPLALLVILPLEMLVLSRLFPAKTYEQRNIFNLHPGQVLYPGASVGPPVSATPIPFSYRPPGSSWFRMFAAADYDLQAGFIHRAYAQAQQALPQQPCRSAAAMQMSLYVHQAGRVLLPLPPGHVIDTASVVNEMGRHLPVFSAVLGETSVVVTGNRGTVFYRSCPQSADPGLTPGENARLTFLPAGLEFPPELERALAEARPLAVAEKVIWAGAQVSARIRTDDSPSTAAAYRSESPHRHWLSKVLAIGKGDCDVVNGALVLFLRKMGIPARLVIGMIGSGGRVQTGLHAWSEYFDGGWKIYDASILPGETLPTGSSKPRLAENDPPNSPAAPLPGNDNATFPLILIPTAFVLCLGLGIFIKFKRSRPKHAVVSLAAPERIKECLIPIMQQALLQPEIWGQQSPLWSHRFLPTVNGKSMTFGRLLALLRRGRLLFTTSANPLAAAMARKGIPVLDLSHDVFAPLSRLLAGAVNLESLFRLRPQPQLASPLPPEACLLYAVNDLLGNLLKKRPLCLLTPGLQDASFLNVSLPAAPLPGRFYFPRRFIAVNPASAELQACSTLFGQNRPLAIFKFLKILRAESLLPVVHPDALLKKASRLLLRQYP